ncbi:MAG: hypothetical protein AUJ85_00950 [Elusimicrobia bacterium CG1_02_37_114]|nr:MAG: hypothetical protein AUJ85_00950 [Elusimicrobia bacterium CG1_02_37_114]PIV52580.1 MAG: iron ABC transporter [Elusimicrobia bacterium CG02_land_8_20_14_3_00_37_13]
MKLNKIILFISLTISLIVAAILCLTFGASKIGLYDTVYTLLHPGSENIFQSIIWQIRFPRIIFAIIVGAGLAATGCIFQGLLRNPLADPYTLGTSGGAAFGVTLCVVTGLLKSGILYMPIFAFLGAFVSILLVYEIASMKRFSISTLILGGVVLNFLFSSFVLFIFSIMQTENVHSTILWLMGDLSSARIELIKIISFVVILGIILLSLFSRELDLLTLGEEKATYLGMDTENVRKIFFIIASIIVGACVSVSGIIGFVGLLIPHLMRKITGPVHAVLIPASALAGAIFLTICDTLARTIIAPIELPVGVITGIFGSLVFLSFLIKSKKWEIF